MKILNGRKIAAEIKNLVKQEVKKKPSPPGLAAILVGNDEASKTYINLKEKACREVGINFFRHEFPKNLPQDELISLIKVLNKDKYINGILIQLPLPKNLEADQIIQAIDPKKDADGFHQENFKLLKAGRPRIIPPLLAGILKLLEETKQNLESKTAVILANSQKFAQPLQVLLANHNIKSLSLIRTPGFTQVSQKADILITALGQPHLIKSEQIKKGAILIDAGFTRRSSQIMGDIDPASVQNKAAFLSPVPGGVGPLTVAYLLKNVVKLARN